MARRRRPAGPVLGRGAGLGAAAACSGHREPLPPGAAAALSSAAQSLPCPPAPAIMPLTRSRRPPTTTRYPPIGALAIKGWAS